MPWIFQNWISILKHKSMRTFSKKSCPVKCYLSFGVYLNNCLIYITTSNRFDSCGFLFCFFNFCLTDSNALFYNWANSIKGSYKAGVKNTSLGLGNNNILISSNQFHSVLMASDYTGWDLSIPHRFVLVLKENCMIEKYFPFCIPTLFTLLSRICCSLFIRKNKKQTKNSVQILLVIPSSPFSLQSGNQKRNKIICLFVCLFVAKGLK